jgi:hypothetical protein
VLLTSQRRSVRPISPAQDMVNLIVKCTSQQSVPFDLRVYSTRLLRMICSILAELLAYFQDQRFDPPELCRVPRRK